MKKRTTTPKRISFTYTAYDDDGLLVRGEYIAAGRGEVLEFLLAKGLKPVQISARAVKGGGLSAHLFEHITTEDILFFTRNFATTLQMGVPATEALELIIADLENRKMQVMLRNVLISLKAGNSFVESFRPYKEHFPPMFLGMIAAGELSGNLDKTLMVFSEYVERTYLFRNRVRSALFYPLVILTASIAVSILVIMVMVPRLSHIFAEANIRLPLITRVMIAISDALTFSYILDIAVLAGLISLALWFVRTERGRSLLSSVVLNMPLTRGIVHKTVLVRSMRTLSTLLSSDIPIIEALTLSGEAAGNARIEEAIDRVSKKITSGKTLSDSFACEPEYFPKLLIGLIAVGERTGKLADTLKSVSDFYEQSVDERLKRTTSLIEPLLLLAMGLVVGLIALSVLLPIYQLVGAVQ